MYAAVRYGPPTMTDASNSQATSAPVAKQIGLSVPMNERAVKAYVKTLADTDTQKCRPRQVQKKSVVAVAAAVERLLAVAVDECLKGVQRIGETDGTKFQVEHVTKSLRGNDKLGFLTVYLLQGETHIAQKNEPRVPEGDVDASDQAGNATEVAKVVSVSFSCSSNITARVKAAFTNIEISDDAVELIQYILDQFYQDGVAGAYWIAQIHDRKTIQKNDIVVAFKILLHKDPFAILDHVVAMTSKYEDVEGIKKVKAKKSDASNDTKDAEGGKQSSDGKIKAAKKGKGAAEDATAGKSAGAAAPKRAAEKPAQQKKATKIASMSA